VTGAEVYLHAKFNLDPCNRLATIHQRYRQTGQRPDSTGRTVLGRPFVKRFALSYRIVVLSVCLSVTLVYCGQTVAWIKIKLGMQVDFSPGHIVLDGDPASHRKRGIAPNFRPMSVVAKRLDGLRCHSWYEGRPRSGSIVLDGDPAPPSSQKRGTQPPPLFRPCLLWPNG